MKQRIVFVDVDDTLVRSFGTKRIPMPSAIAHVRELHQQGVRYTYGAPAARTTLVPLQQN